MLGDELEELVVTLAVNCSDCGSSSRSSGSVPMLGIEDWNGLGVGAVNNVDDFWLVRVSCRELE